MSLIKRASTLVSKLTKADGVEKLTMTAYKDILFSAKTKGIEPFKVPFNPNSLNLKLQVNRNEDKDTNTQIHYIATPPQDFGFDFIIDATGFEGGKDAIANAREATTDKKHTYIVKQIELLKKIVYDINGEKHEPNFIRITYGNILLDCVLNTLDITYTLFDKTGYPLRAKINLSFKTISDKQKEDAKNHKNSPDLTHVRELKQHDHFLNMSNDIYDENFFYVQVARANNMNCIRENKTGKRIVFPPIIEKENLSI